MKANRRITLGLSASRTWIAEQKSLRRALRQHMSLLSPGLYVTDGRLMQKRGAQQPEHVRLTRGRKLWSTARWSGRLFLAGRRLFVPPLVVTRRRGRADGATIGVYSRPREVVLLAPASGWMRRISADAAFDQDYINLRKVFSNYVSCPNFRVERAGSIVVEDFILGRSTVGLESSTRIEVVRGIVGGLVDLIEKESAQSIEGHYEDRIGRLGVDYIPEPMRRWVELASMKSIMASGPLVPSHGDMGPHNVIVQGADGIVIDISADLGWRPFWFDSLALIVRTAPDAYFSGSFDREVRKLWLAAGEQPPALEQFRSLLAASTAIWFTEYFRQNAVGGELPADFAAQVSGFWQRPWLAPLRKE